jgi:uncharacterized OB-fold protein
MTAHTVHDAPELPEGAKPRVPPIPDADSAAFWSATNEGRLLVQHCNNCGCNQLYGRALCTNCHSDELEWIETAGLGTVYSRTVIRQNPSRAYRHLLPLVVALVDLDEGPRLMTNVVGSEPDDVQIGARVKVRFERVSDEAALPMFELAN